MILNHYFSIDGVDNFQGYCAYWFIHDQSVTYIPPAVNGIVDFEKIIYKPGKDTWYKGGAIFDSINLGEKEKKDANGSLYPINISGKTAGITPSVLSLFHQKRNGRFIVIIADNNGNYFLCGEPNNGILFSYSREAAYFAFTYAGNYTIPCYFLSNYLGSNPTPEPGGGGEGGGIVTIKRADGTTITTIEAPAEYTVANTNAVLKDTAGNILSTTSIKAAGAAQDIEAPNAIVQVINTDTDVVAFSSIKAAEVKNVAVPDTHVVVKNTLAEIIDDSYIASASDAEIIIGDSTVNIRDTAGTLIESKTAPAEKVVTTTIPDSTVEATNSIDEIIATVSVKAAGSDSLPIADSAVTLNGDAWLSIPATNNKDIALVDELDNVITPLVADATQIKVQLFQSDSAIVRRAARYANLIITGNSNSIIR